MAEVHSGTPPTHSGYARRLEYQEIHSVFPPDSPDEIGVRHRSLRITADRPRSEPAALGRWAETLGLTGDFSGHVTYRKTVSLPEAMRAGRLLLELGGLEYAAKVSIDGREVGRVLWCPWRIELPPLDGRAEFVLEIQVADTLANEITSERVRGEWGKRRGLGGPSPYHAREVQFEMESRGGGLLGPVRLLRAVP